MKRLILIFIQITLRCIFLYADDSHNIKSNDYIESTFLIDQNNSNIVIQITNNFPDTLYLFDSYFASDFFLSDKLWKSEYLYRYNKHNKTDVISFVPLIPYLGPCYRGDRWYFGNIRIVKNGKILWHFQAIAPTCTIEISLPIEILYHIHKYYDIKETHNNKFEKGLKFHERKVLSQSQNKIIEFAIYKKVELLLDREAYYYNEFKYNEQAINFIKLTISIDNNTTVKNLYMHID